MVFSICFIGFCYFSDRFSFIVSGDINQDGIIDASDLSETDNDAYSTLSGYVRADVTGDDYVDAADVNIVDNNSYIRASIVSPKQFQIINIELQINLYC